MKGVCSSYGPGLHLCHCVHKSPQAHPAHPEIKPDQALGGWGRGSRLDCGFVALLTHHDEELWFLSREERECILFLEETINIFDDDLEDRDQFPQSSSPAGSRQAVADAAAAPALSSSLKEQDIIDLVQVQPDPPSPREVPHTSIMPDFRTIGLPPEAHTEVKVRRDQMDSQPVGSIPTPMVIAQKIAAHQGSGGPATTSAPPGHRRSLDFTGDYSAIPLPDHPVKQGPPTTAKPSRYPDNISVALPSRDYNQTIAKASVNVHQRQAQVLANLTGRPHAYESMEEKQVRKVPNRSISFHDLTPNKSRMEALSKLGLTKERKLSAFTDAHSQYAPRTGRQNRTASFSVGQLASTSSERRRSISKPPFWSQGITVQFSGRGPTDESRREALRKLGLLKDTS
uniref:Proline and serine rich 2 n=1 Tax=Paramormyrops kingsleyae TaxID=1676925 RepID=A0A3B3QYN2_9TELE